MMFAAVDSEESAVILAGSARFLAAHTPTWRQLPTIVQIATRLRRGEPLYEEADLPVNREPEHSSSHPYTHGG